MVWAMSRPSLLLLVGLVVAAKPPRTVRYRLCELSCTHTSGGAVPSDGRASDAMMLWLWSCGGGGCMMPICRSFRFVWIGSNQYNVFNMDIMVRDRYRVRYLIDV